MDIQLHGGGRWAMSGPQQRWSGDDQMQTAVFAGQEMIAVADDFGGYRLTYLAYEARGFLTIDGAKESASEFASRVLARMASMIAP
ncbi:hypothetical protein [Cupriavidus basilensis]|uniref:Uncharacterized protein n=1 Tax=Cupriavidus basilensis TaxID=68895 RepID=A0A643FSI8_9BURK|nr:hypothetical protein [Cupriavidus basilensis]QOT82204.1 hypothetical protein F7R26_039525 [Cupriavidus basilensis]